MRNALIRLSALAITLPAAGAALPTDMETLPSLPDRIYSYFGGVSSFSVSQSATLCYSDSSLRLDIAFQPSIFTIAGVGIGSLGISAPLLSVPPDADTFSVTIKAPETGQLAFFVTIQEDDNNDGIIDIANGDDEWESPLVMLTPGVVTYNIPVASFTLTDQGSGNGVNNFTTTGRMAYVLDIHTRSTFPGGLVIAPTTLYLDHIGLFAGAQAAPPSHCAGNANDDQLVDFQDITAVLNFWQMDYSPGTGPGDADGDGFVEFADLSTVLANWLATCP